MTASTHLHITTWVIAIILFLIALGLQKSSNAKAQKIVHMVLRLFYVLTVLSGGMLVHIAFTAYPLMYTLKMIFGILVIGFFEMVLVRGKKGKKTTTFWVLLIVSLLITIYLGFALPIGAIFF